MKIVSFNLRCEYDGDGINSFIHRVGFLSDKILSEMPDMIGFQEVTPRQLTVLERLLPEYHFVGGFRTAEFDDEGLYTALRRDTCTLLGFDCIWLSPTPFVPGSRYPEQSECPRILINTLIRCKENGQIFRLCNIHLDHISEQAQCLGLECALSHIGEKTRDGHPVVLLGDFNAFPDSKIMRILSCHRNLLDATAEIPITFHLWGKVERKIDYIYLSPSLFADLRSAEIWDDVHAGIFLSDHYPVVITL